MNLSHNLLLIHCTSKNLSRSRYIFCDIRYATLHTYQLLALSLAGRDAKTIHIWNQEEDSMHVWAEIETLLCATQKRNTIMANSIVIIAVICYSTLLYIMNYYGIFIVYYVILLYIYRLLLKSSLSLWHNSSGRLTVDRNHTIQWVGTTLIQGLQGCFYSPAVT